MGYNNHILMKHSSFVLSHPRKAFTLIELLVVIAIIAILAVVVVLTLNPAQLLAQSRDSTRVSDLATLNSALSLYQIDQGGTGNTGTSSIVYTSLSDTSSTCGNLNLPLLPTGYTYNCTVSTSTKNINTSGWIPLNFQTISSGAPFGTLPVDPTNTSSSGLYYTYDTNGSQYETTASMESSKYKLGGSNDVISGDGGLLTSVYEKGTGLGLEPLDYGDNSLVGYWPMDEGTGSSTRDMSGNGNTGTWSGTPVGTSGYYSPGKVGPWAGTFASSTNVIISRIPTLPNNNFSFSLWFYLNQTAMSAGYSENLLSSFNLYQHLANNYIYLGSGARYMAWTPSAGTWHYLACSITHSGTTSSGSDNWQGNCYGDGTLLTLNQNSYLSSPTNLTIGGGGKSLNGSIDDVRIYNRALSAGEIQAMYNAGK